ncbi:MAG: 50S ribosomal protein L16 [Candidatus Parcubacteria bacterium]|nr:MAG: 50S ribosomal protein L16 [Candidatus Parcubacteria bacterium]
MLQPKKLKYRKAQKGRSLKRELITKGTELTWGDLGLKSLETRMITSKQIKACLDVLKKNLGKKGRYWLRIFPHKPKTKKPPETRMGGGKGDVEDYVAVVRPGTILFEVGGLDKELLKDVLKQTAYKLPIKTKIVEK